MIVAAHDNSDAIAKVDSVAVSAGFAGVAAGVGLASNFLTSTTAAHVSDSSVHAEGGFIRIDADATQDVNADASVVAVTATLAGAAAAGGHAQTHLDSTVEAFAHNASLTASGNLFIDADSDHKARAKTFGFGAAVGFAVSTMISEASVGGETRAYADGTTTINVNTRAEITADSIAEALPDADSVAVGLIGGAIAMIDADVDRVTEAYVGTPYWTTPTATTTLLLGTDDLLVRAKSTLTANASPLNIAFGLYGAAGVTYSTANISGATLAYVGENTTVLAGELDLVARSIEEASANNVTGSFGGVVDVTVSDARAVIESATEAFTGARAGAHYSSDDTVNELLTGERVLLASDIGGAKAGEVYEYIGPDRLDPFNALADYALGAENYGDAGQWQKVVPQAGSTVITLTDAGNGDGTLVIDADGSRAATASASGVSGSLGVNVDVYKPTAIAAGSVLAYVGEGSNVTADDLTVTADAIAGAPDPAMVGMTANATVFSIGLAGFLNLAYLESLASVEGEVEAFIGVQARQLATDAATPVLNISGTQASDGDIKVHADAEMAATADVKGGTGTLGISVDLTKPTAKVSGSTRAYVREGSDLTSDSLLVEAGNLSADPDSRVRYLATATSFTVGFSGLAGVSLIDASATVDGAVEAFVGTPIGQSVPAGLSGQVDVQDSVRILAASDMDAVARVDNGNVSLGITLSLVSTDADVAGDTRAYVGQGANILTHNNDLDLDGFSGLDIDADGDYDASAKALIVGASVAGGGADHDSYAVVSGSVDAHVGAAAETAASNNLGFVDVQGGSVAINAVADMLAKPELTGIGLAGGVYIGNYELLGEVTGNVLAYIGEGVDVDAGNVAILADATQMMADTQSVAVNIAGLVAASIVEATSTVSGKVDAFIGAYATRDAADATTDVDVNSGDIRVFADAYMYARAKTDGGGFSGLASISSFKPTALVSGSTSAYVRDGVNMDAGSLQVRAGNGAADRVTYKAEATSVTVNISFGGTVQDLAAFATVSGTVEAYLGAPDARTGGGQAGAKLDVSDLTTPVIVTAKSDIDAIAKTEGGGGGVGVSVALYKPTAVAGGTTRAFVGDGAELWVGGDGLTLLADGDAKSDATLLNIAIAGGASVGGLSPVAQTTNVVEAYVGRNVDAAQNSQITVLIKGAGGSGRGDIDIDAKGSSEALAVATSFNFAGGASVSLIRADSDLLGATRAYIGKRVDLTAGTVDILADEIKAVSTARMDGAAAALVVTVSDIKVEAAASRETEAFIGNYADIDLTGHSISLRANTNTGSDLANAEINSGSGAGLANISLMDASARVGLVDAEDASSQASATRAYVGNHVELDAVNLTLDADANTSADAEVDAPVTIGGIANVTLTNVIGTAAHDTEAYVGNDGDLNLTGWLKVTADAETTATPSANRAGGSFGVDFGDTDVTTLIDSDTSAWIGDGTDVNATWVKLWAKATHDAQANIESLGIAGILSIASLDAVAKDTGTVNVRIGSTGAGSSSDRTHITTTSSLGIDADAIMDSTVIAEPEANNFGLVGAGVVKATAYNAAQATGRIGGWVDLDVLAGDFDMLVEVIGLAKGAATATAGGFGAITSSTADVDFDARAKLTVGEDGNIDASSSTGDVRLTARVNHNGSNYLTSDKGAIGSANNIAVGLASVTTANVNVDANSSVEIEVGKDTRFNTGGGDVIIKGLHANTAVGALSSKGFGLVAVTTGNVRPVADGSTTVKFYGDVGNGSSTSVRDFTLKAEALVQATGKMTSVSGGAIQVSGGNANATAHSDLSVDIGASGSDVFVTRDILVRGYQNTDVVARGSGSGVGGITVNSLRANATATSIFVDADILGGSLRGRDVTLEGISDVDALANASHTSGGAITVGTTHANTYARHQVETHIHGGSITAQRDVEIFATGAIKANSVSATNGSFSGVSDADANAYVDVDYDVITRVNGSVSALRTILIEARSDVDADLDVRANATAIAGFADADGTINIGASNDRSVTQTVLEGGADLTGNTVVVSAQAGTQLKVDSSDGSVVTDNSGPVTQWNANAYALSDTKAFPVADSTADAYANGWDMVETILHDGSSIVSNEDITVQSKHRNTSVFAHAVSKYNDYDNALANAISAVLEVLNPIPVLVEPTASSTYNDLTRVSGRYGSFLKASDVFVLADSNASVTRDADRETNLPDLRICIGAGDAKVCFNFLNVNGSEKGSASKTVARQIFWESHVALLGEPNPELVVDENGVITTLTNIEFLGENAGKKVGNTLDDYNGDKQVILDDIIYDEAGKLTFYANDVSGSPQGVIWGNHGLVESQRSWDYVKIINYSEFDLVINHIDAIDSSSVVDIIVDDIKFNAASTNNVSLNPEVIGDTFEFDVNLRYPQSIVEIRNLIAGENDDSDIILLGGIENTIGTTIIENQRGNIRVDERDLVAEQDAMIPAIFDEGLIRTNVLDVDASGDIGNQSAQGGRSALMVELMRITHAVERGDTPTLSEVHLEADADGDTVLDITLHDRSVDPAEESLEVIIERITAGDDIDVVINDSRAGDVLSDIDGLTVRTLEPPLPGGVTLPLPLDISGLGITTNSPNRTGEYFDHFSPDVTGESLYNFIRRSLGTEYDEVDSTYFFLEARAGDDIDIGHVNGTDVYAGAENRTYATTSIGGAPYGASVVNDVPDTTVNFDINTDVAWDDGNPPDGTPQIFLTTNGSILAKEITGDMLVGHINSTGADVELRSGARILDADGTPSVDVSGVNILMSTGVNASTPDFTTPVSNSGIGTLGNWLEINVDRVADDGTGALYAFDTTFANRGIFIDELFGDLQVGTVFSRGHVALRTVDGSIFDHESSARLLANGVVDLTGDEAYETNFLSGILLQTADVMGKAIDLDANGTGSDIGQLLNDLEIDSRRGSTAAGLGAGGDDVALEATDDIYLAEVADELRLVLAHTYTGDIRLTVWEASGATDETSNLLLIDSGFANFAESKARQLHNDDPRTISQGTIFAELGSVTLWVGDDIATDENARIIAATTYANDGTPANDASISILGDANALDGLLSALDADPTFGTEIILRGALIAGAVLTTPGTKKGTVAANDDSDNPVGVAVPYIESPQFVTTIFGNDDADIFQFGDASGVGGGTNPDESGYIFIGAKTRVYGSQNATDSTGDDGEDRFIVYYLQDANAQTGPNMTTAAEHTLTLDGQADTDYYAVYTLGSNGPDQRNYVINILDTGEADDGVDEATIIGRDSSGSDGDDIFLLRTAAFLPNETSDRPGYVALLHGNLDEYQDVVQNNEDSNEVQRINYDTGLNGRLTVEGRAGNDAFFTDDTSVIVTLDGGAGDDQFQIGQIFGANRNETMGNLLPQDIFPDLVATTRGWLSPGISAPLVAQGGSGNDEFRVYSNQAELRLEGDDDNDLFIVRAFALAATTDFDWNGDGKINKADLDAGVAILQEAFENGDLSADTNGDGGINYLDLLLTPETTDDVIVLDDNGVATPQIGLGFSVAQAPDIRAGGGQDEVRYNINAPVSVEGGAGFDKLVILGTEFADDIVITKDGIFGAGLNVRYATIEVVEVDGLEGDDEFFVQSTAFGVAYRVIGGLGSDTINVTGDVTEDIITRELEGVSGAVDHLVTSDDVLYNGLVVDGFDYNVSTALEGLVVINEEATNNGSTIVREESEQLDQFADFYTLRLSQELELGDVVYVTVSAARSPQEERDDLLNNPAPLSDGAGDSIWLSTDPMSGFFTNTYAGLETTADDAFMHQVVIDGQTFWIPDRALVLKFTADGAGDSYKWDEKVPVYVFAPDDFRAEGDRVVVIQHSVISNVEEYDAADVRNVEVQVFDNDTPGVYVTEVDANGDNDGQTIVIEGDATTRLTDEIELQLAMAPSDNSTVVVDVVLNDAADKAIRLSSSDARLVVLATPEQIAGMDTPDDTSDDKFVVARATFTYVDGVSDPNWNDAISIQVEARDDYVREDLQIAVIDFQRGAGTTDADYIFPNLRSGLQLLDVEVYDNETAGAVVLESGGSTQLIYDNPLGSGRNDTYELRLTKAPEENVKVAVLTDGLADVVSIDGSAVTPEDYESVGGLIPTQVYNGKLVYGSGAGNLTLTRGTGSDLGDFTDDGIYAGQTIRIDGSGANDGDYEVLSISLDGKTLTLLATDAAPSQFSGESAAPVTLSNLASMFFFEGDVGFGEELGADAFPGQFLDRDLSGAAQGWLSEGFLEGMWVRIIDLSGDGNPAVEAKIQLIRGDNDSQDAKLQLINVQINDTLYDLKDTWLGDGVADSVRVVRIAPTAVFTAANYHQLQAIELKADENYIVPPTREGVKIFPVSTHLLSKLRGPLAVEGGPGGADRSLTAGVKLPGEKDAFLIAIGAQPPESQQIDVLNIFNDSSQADGTGSMTETTLRGFGMSDDLDFGPVSGPTFGEGDGGNIVVLGGISFGKINLGSSGYDTNGVESSIEVFNLMLGEGNDYLDVSGTLNPAPFVSAENAFETTSVPVLPSAAAGTVAITLEGYDWKAQGFLPGQTVYIEGKVGSWTVVSVEDRIYLDADGRTIYVDGNGDAVYYDDTLDAYVDKDGVVVDVSGLEPMRDPSDNSILVLSGPALSLDGLSDVLITAIDPLVIDEVGFSVAPTEGGVIVTRTDNGDDWETLGFLEGHLVSVGGYDDAVQYRVLEIDGNKMTLLGDTDLTAGTEMFWVQGPHGGLTTLHGGGNLFVQTLGDYDATTVDSDNLLTRMDGRNWRDDGYEVGQLIQVGGEGETREILAIVDANPALKPDGEFATWGKGSTLILGGAGFGGGLINDVDVHLSVPETTVTEVSLVTLVVDTLIRDDGGNWLTDGFEVGQIIYIDGIPGGFTIKEVNETELVLAGAALHDCIIETSTVTITRTDITKDAGAAIGGDHFVIVNNANGALVGGPLSPLVIYGDTSQDGAWYSGHSYDRLGQEFGEKPFDPFPWLSDAENEDNEWVFPLANPFRFAGNDIIDASGLFAGWTNEELEAQFITVGITAYGGAGNDLIIGSQAGDHLAGGSGDDVILGQRGVDHIYGDSGINVDILTRALHIATHNNSPAPTIDPSLGASDQTFAPVPVPYPVADNLTAGRDFLEGDGRVGGIDAGIADLQNIIFGDHGEVVQLVADPNLPPVLLQKIQTTSLDTVLEINSLEPQNGADDIIFGTAIADLLIGGGGNDMIDGREGDDLIFGDNVFLSRMGGDDGDLLDDIKNARFQALAGAVLYSRTDLTAEQMGLAAMDPLYAYAASGPGSLNEYNSGRLLTDGIARNYRDPNGPQWWAEYEIDYAVYHTFAINDGLAGVGSFGNDYLAGGAGNDTIFGQLGNDVIQGDGSIDSAVAGIAHVGAARKPVRVDPEDSGIDDPVGELFVVASFEAASDGEDYIEGGGGKDVIFGGLGQDDIVGGSSSFFSLDGYHAQLLNPDWTGADLRPDSSDWLFGGAGTQINRNNGFDPDAGEAPNVDQFGADIVVTVDTDYQDKHARDSDAIVGDNGDIIRIVGINGDDVNPHPETNPLAQNYVTFNYDDYGTEKIVVRGIRLLDYTPGGPDYDPDSFSLEEAEGMRPMFSLDCDPDQGIWTRYDIGGNDEVHGETGDDFIYLGGGFDIGFGDADDDDIIGGWGHDWISGGTGIDGILGDDGRIFTSRNTASPLLAESLYGIGALLATDPDTRTSQGNVLNELIRTPGNVQSELINVAGELKKSVDLTPYNLTPEELGAADPRLSNQMFADDVIFGGLGKDFIHGGSGDDAISGAEALEESYAPRFNSAGEFIGLIRTDFSRPYNPSDILHFGDDYDAWNSPKPVQSRLGEFFLYDEYEPRRVILFDTDAGSVWKGDLKADGSLPDLESDGLTGGEHLLQYFLNWNSDEGVSVLGYVAFKPDGRTPDPDVPEQYRQSDGDDVIFGDLGNDWIVGGTGRDHIYGGFGNDLMNADDVLGTVNPDYPPHNSPGQLPLGGTDETPDTHLVYEDRVFGGAGLDILIGNTKGDRLIDWVGEFNSFIVPFAPFGIATVSRQVPPHLFDFLFAQAFSDGVDVTRTADTGQRNHNDRYSNVAKLQGGINGEMGLVTQQDHGYWQDQTGGPTDPQAGNVPGGRRDVLRTSDFNNASMDLFVRDTGNFSVSGGRLQISAASGEQASAFYNLDDYLPIYYEVSALIQVDKPTGGAKANGYIIFDYKSDIDFKYAGINISTNKIEMGYRDASGWHEVVQSNKPVRIKPGEQYEVLIAVNGTNVTLIIEGVNWFSYTFEPLLDQYGNPIPLNKGYVGVGMDGGSGTVDNFKVQILPPEITLEVEDSFDSSDTVLESVSGDWAVDNGTYTGVADTTGYAVSLVDLGEPLRADAYLELEATVVSTGVGGIAFDYYAEDDFKFIAIDAANDSLLIGHVDPKRGLAIDMTLNIALADDVDHHLKLSFVGASVNITLNGSFVATYGFNAGVVDGRFGLMVSDSGAEFEDFRFATNDPRFEGLQMLAAQAASSVVTVPKLEEDDAGMLLDAAYQDWLDSGLVTEADLSALGDVEIHVVDLEGDALAEVDGNVILVDIDAAGWGWFIDSTPDDDSEFDTADGSASGMMDLLTVLRHELGHLLGYDHDGLAVMSDSLEAGTRLEIEGDREAVILEPSEPSTEQYSLFDDGDGAPSPGTAGGSEALTQPALGWNESDPATDSVVHEPGSSAKATVPEQPKRRSAQGTLVFDEETGMLVEVEEAPWYFAMKGRDVA
ncbi:hypothetical protein GCM10011348_16530 [Marinobacterium nitratireducens]|uniref:Uncharacterized protein n=1 Tax=Marinobacterium nitratireducens TaxID=518897 RepID=A0A917ZBT8_9GAMM|nr:hypothetical protein GCM10011348_16530 [Marinobacterium nitratireducens]